MREIKHDAVKWPSMPFRRTCTARSGAGLYVPFDLQYAYYGMLTNSVLPMFIAASGRKIGSLPEPPFAVQIDTTRHRFKPAPFLDFQIMWLILPVHF